MPPCKMKIILGILAIACIGLLSTNSVSSQTSTGEAKPSEDQPHISEKLNAAIEDAFENLSHRKFGVRQTAIQRLVNAAPVILPKIENRALVGDADFQSHCISIISLIGQNKGMLEQAIATMQRLSNDPQFSSSGRASEELFILRGVQVSRAIRSLTHSGVRVNQIGTGGPVYSVSSITKDEQCKHLKLFPKLSSLSMGGTGITDACIEHLSKAKTLNSLNLTTSNISSKGIAQMKSLQNLSRLSLAGTVPTANILEVAKLKQITSLQLSTKLAEDGLKAIAQLPLSSLMLQNIEVSANTAEIMRDVKAHQLILSMTSIEDSDLEWIKGCKAASINLNIYNAKKLTDKGIRSLENTNITQLQLSTTGITEKAMKPIGSLKKLRTLTITNSPINDESLNKLSELKELSQLRLTGTKVTGDGMAAIKEKLSKLSYTQPAATVKKQAKKDPNKP